MDTISVESEAANAKGSGENEKTFDGLSSSIDTEDKGTVTTTEVSYTMLIDGTVHGLEPAFSLTGTVTNTGGEDWNDSVRIGLRQFRDRSGRILSGVEFRGLLDREWIATGESAEFSFDISGSEIPQAAVTCEVDLVWEGRFWFAEHGAIPSVVPVAGFRDPTSRVMLAGELARLPRLASPEARRKVQIVQEALRRYDFSGYEIVRQLYDMCKRHESGLPYQQPIPSSNYVASSLSGDGNARNWFINGFACRAKLSTGADPSDRGVFAPIFKKFIQRSREVFRDASPPLPHDVIRWLSSRALPVELAANPISRSMVLGCGDTFSFHLNRPESFLSAAWVYVTSVLIDGNLSADLVPEAIAAQLATSPRTAADPGAFPQLTGFMRRLLQDVRDYSNRYDVNTDAGRLAYAFDLLLLGVNNEVRRFFLGQEVMRWLTEPISADLDASPFELLAMGNSGDRSMVDLGQPSIVTTGVRRLYDWTPAATAATRYPLRVIGRYSTSSGLSTNMRMSLRVLDEGGIATEIVDADRDLILPAALDDGTTTRLSRPVDLFHLNPDDLPALIARYSGCDRPRPYRIGFALWESSVMPEEHRAGAELMDELWVPSRYLEQVYRNAGFDNVQVIGKAIDVSAVEPLDRSAVGLPNDAFIFATSFDLDSWVERKNPVAVADAFGRAFPGLDDVRLVVKTTGIFSHPGDRTRQIARLLAAADTDPRIILINEHMPFGRYLGVIAMADATISSHRSEGFGYFPAYSLALERPTIVSDHSGTEDFCTPETAFPVSAPLVPIRPGDFVYDTPNAQWADIDVDALADAMRQVRSDPAEARRRVLAGNALMNEQYSYAAMRTRYEKRLRDFML